MASIRTFVTSMVLVLLLCDISDSFFPFGRTRRRKTTTRPTTILKPTANHTRNDTVKITDPPRQTALIPEKRP